MNKLDLSVPQNVRKFMSAFIFFSMFLKDLLDRNFLLDKGGFHPIQKILSKYLLGEVYLNRIGCSSRKFSSLTFRHGKKQCDDGMDVRGRTWRTRRAYSLCSFVISSLYVCIPWIIVYSTKLSRLLALNWKYRVWLCEGVELEFYSYFSKGYNIF